MLFHHSKQLSLENITLISRIKNENKPISFCITLPPLPCWLVWLPCFVKPYPIGAENVSNHVRYSNMKLNVLENVTR